MCVRRVASTHIPGRSLDWAPLWSPPIPLLIKLPHPTWYAKLLTSSQSKVNLHLFSLRQFFFKNGNENFFLNHFLTRSQIIHAINCKVNSTAIVDWRVIAQRGTVLTVTAVIRLNCYIKYLNNKISHFNYLGCNIRFNYDKDIEMKINKF